MTSAGKLLAEQDSWALSQMLQVMDHWSVHIYIYAMAVAIVAQRVGIPLGDQYSAPHQSLWPRDPFQIDTFIYYGS